MASTARSKDETKEYFDPPEELDRKVTLLAQWVRESKHMMAFTGAGISTSAGIPDFRSGMHTSLPTGPGVWELRAHKQARPKASKTTDVAKAIPTVTHMAMLKLHEEGLLKCVVSQNTDGLHRRSGLPKNALYELHGNRYVEKCVRCKRDYLRDYRVRTSKKVHQHLTGNLCDDPKCKGKLKDTIINFGEDLPDDALEAGFDHARRADLCLAMGSSLTVTPAADIPETVGEKDQRLVVVNLQRTPLDPLAKLCIGAKCDDVSRLLMEKLGLQIQGFKLRRRLVVSYEAKPSQNLTNVCVKGEDVEGHPFSFLREVTFSVDGRVQHRAKEEPFGFLLRWDRRSQVCVSAEVCFHAHYGEPLLKQLLNIQRGKTGHWKFSLEFAPGSHEWTVHQDPGVDIRGAGNQKSEVEELASELKHLEV